jgi:hypothetical protein
MHADGCHQWFQESRTLRSRRLIESSQALPYHYPGRSLAFRSTYAAYAASDLPEQKDK